MTNVEDTPSNVIYIPFWVFQKTPEERPGLKFQKWVVGSYAGLA